MAELTIEQRAAVESAGKTIVSASAGSGKTFVMIKKLVAAVESGVDLDNVLAVTFTKKAAAQMKEKLRSAIIAALDGADGEKRARLKVQLSKIPQANISTIHAFCAKLLRTYFYAVGIDGSFEIISADDAAAKEYKNRALDALFERYYAENDENFAILLDCFRRKRSDASLKALVLESYEKVRVYAGYLAILDAVKGVFTDEGFARVCDEYAKEAAEKYALLSDAVDTFAANFSSPRKETYDKIFSEMKSALETARKGGIFSPLPPLNVTRKPSDTSEEGAEFTAFKKEISKMYTSARGAVEDEDTERKYFFGSGKTAVAFAEVLKQFDAEYTAVKRDENKLDYNDLEHLTLALLDDEEIRRGISGRFNCVFVDEYQDVNPVQEEIITRIGGDDVFLVGDVKQAIYGFRGSKSLFFAEKYASLDGGGGNALRLTDNFRSSDGVLAFVNSLFSEIMTVKSCGFDYSVGSVMRGGGGYPSGEGVAKVHIFGKDEEEKPADGVYSVKNGGASARHSREGLAVLEIVRRELGGRHYDLKTGGYVDTQPGDICILTRKRSGGTAGIVAALTDAGYSVSGAQDANICKRAEVRQMLDILSYIDNAEQDVPLTTALLSPLGGLTCDELAAVRGAAAGKKSSFCECCKKYSERSDAIAEKLKNFYTRTERLRDLAEVFGAAEIIDRILEETGLEASLAAGSGEKLKNIRRLCGECGDMSVSAFLAKLKEGGYEISSPAAASSESIKIMTMHASKGLEFPVVIISDICASFKGKDYTDMPFDERFGFAPKYYDKEKMLVRTTVLRRLVCARSDREELKNELNLFYVACTRAMCNLHILAREVTPYSRFGAAEAKCYARLFDTNRYAEELEVGEDFKKSGKITLLSSPDRDLQAEIEKRFMRGYSHSDSVNLPVKSSASAILKMTDEDECYHPRQLYSGEGETGTERGTAYHRFLELCDFTKTQPPEIAEELDGFVKCGSLSAEARSLLDENGLSEILNMPVFASLNGARLFREREFLCRLPANELFAATSAEDPVLVQGAIDLLAVTDNGVMIIDYKYSHKDDEELIKTYGGQLALYKKAVSLIMRVDERTVGTVIVNIFKKRMIKL